MEKGINVLDPETHESYGTSVAAARSAVLQTSISRIFLNVTIFFPPIALYWIEKKRWMPKHYILRTIVEAFFISLELYFAVPVGIALYPRYGQISASKLEPEFQGIKNRRGELVQDFVFNKGL